ESEIQAIRDLTAEAIKAGFYNIDIDTSTLVDLSKESIAEQQSLNYGIAASLSEFIRNIEPEGVTVSIGGEIGEVGGHNSTEEELRAYLDGYNAELAKKAPGAAGLSKISIQTGTSHGGVVLPDGSLAEVTIDFDILQNLGIVGRESYGIGGTVQHGASTLPEDAFDKFVSAEALEVHLATNFQNIMFDHLPEDLVNEIYAYVDEHHERKSSQTVEQFHYKNRKRAIGAYKKQIWGLSEAKKQEITQAWEKQFRNLFARLSVADTKKYVKKYIKLIKIEPKPEDYFPKDVQDEDVSDLAD
ncbi:MAG: class II fructose-bisphosphate aldolase, partial [Chloroflexota bacterium]|nr:class II fructose-bisphosphate aldolase [Chloroflexota bacterium]